MFRSGTYWACVCQIAVTPSTGAIVVEKYTIAVDPGIVVNPMQLKRQVEGGAMMGISHALAGGGDVRRKRRSPARDWRTYPILKMADIPEIKVVLLNRPEVGAYGGGSEAANALAAPAMRRRCSMRPGRSAPASAEAGVCTSASQDVAESRWTRRNIFCVRKRLRKSRAGIDCCLQFPARFNGEWALNHQGSFRGPEAHEAISGHESREGSIGDRSFDHLQIREIRRMMKRPGEGSVCRRKSCETF